MLIGIYEGELYVRDNGDNCFDVYRPVKQDMLERLRTAEGLKDYGWDDLWRMEVSAGHTELGLDEWLEDVLSEVDMNDPEDFPSKEDGGFDRVTDEEREKAEAYLSETQGIEFGTWECCGCYRPKGDFDLVLRDA